MPPLSRLVPLSLALSLTACTINVNQPPASSPPAPTDGQAQPNGQAQPGTPAQPDTPTQPNAPSQPNAPAPNQAAGKPADLMELSQFESGSKADLTIGADGALYAVYRDKPPSGKAQTYVRISRDNGATWSQPENLSGSAEQQTMRVAAATDGRGRIYAIWDAQQAPANFLDPETQQLFFRVYEDGQWGQPMPIDTTRFVHSWFASVNAKGEPHVVWSEFTRAGSSYSGRMPGTIMQAMLSGDPATPVQPRLVVQSQPKDPAAVDYLQQFDRYEDLHGYVDDAGQAHFALKYTQAGNTQTDTFIALWSNGRLSPLASFPTYGTTVDPYYQPPQLVLDGQGRQHLLVQDIKSDHHAVLDFNPAAPAGQPQVIIGPASADGVLRTFQTIAHGGRVTVVASYRDSAAPGLAEDAFRTDLSATGWSAPMNLTTNKLRESYKDFNANDTSVYVVYEPHFAAGRFGADNRLNLLMVNAAFQSTAIGVVGEDRHGDLVQGTAYGAFTIPKVYFGKF